MLLLLIILFILFRPRRLRFAYFTPLFFYHRPRGCCYRYHKPMHQYRHIHPIGRYI